MKQVKISEEGVGADAVTVIRVKQGSLGGLLFFIPVMIGVFLLFGLVPGLFEGNVTPSLMCGVAFAAFFTLVWGFVAVNENWSQVYVFDQSFKCVWESEEIEDRSGWRVVVSPSHPDSVFLFNSRVACYRLVKK